MTHKFTEADEGKRVILPARPDEDIEEERGVIISVDEASQTICVDVDEEYRNKGDFADDDDGVRETTFDDAVFEGDG